jgi:aryl-alcohol dehydrogenase-like predicted oxidoreductase
MERRTPNDTDLVVSRVCLGTMTFGAQVNEADAADMVDWALDHGVNFIDTANVYNAGRSEEMLGRILRARRDRVVLASKVGNKMGDGPAESGLSREAIAKGIDDSLRRLQTDHLDLYYLHQPDYATPLEESLEAMDRAVRAGKVRHIGASNYAGWQVCRLLCLAEVSGGPRVRVVQPMYNLLARGIEQEFVPMCKAFGLTTVAYNPLAGGLLTGKHPAEAPLAGTRFERMPAYKDRYWHPANFVAVQELSKVAEVEGRSLTSLALCWQLYHTSVDCVILGASRQEQLRENLEAVERGPLSKETIDVCETVWNQLQGPVPKYNR